MQYLFKKVHIKIKRYIRDKKLVLNTIPYVGNIEIIYQFVLMNIQFKKSILFL